MVHERLISLGSLFSLFSLPERWVIAGDNTVDHCSIVASHPYIPRYLGFLLFIEALEPSGGESICCGRPPFPPQYAAINSSTPTRFVRWLKNICICVQGTDISVDSAIHY